MVVCSMYRMHIKAKKASWKLESLYPLKVSKGLPVVQFSDEEIQFPHAWSQVMEAGLREEGPQAALCTAKWQIMQGGSSDIGYTLTVSNASDLTATVLWLHGCNKGDVAIHTENVFHLQKTQDLLRLGQQRRHLLTCRSHFATLTPKRYFVVSKRLMTGDISIVLLLCC